MTSLSKNVLSMKFMQRTKERIEEKQEVESMFGKTANDTNQQPEVEVWRTEDSHVPCEGLLFGRMSFRGFNPEIERLMAEKRGVKYQSAADVADESVDVTVAEMAKIQTGKATTATSKCDPLSNRSAQVKRKRNQYIGPVDD